MSGERKALVIYLILTALLFARGRLALIVPALAAAFVGLLLLSTLIENPYLQKQIRTLVEPGGSGNYEYVLATGRYLPGDTPSDVQRAFALHVSSQMFAEHPFSASAPTSTRRSSARRIRTRRRSCGWRSTASSSGS